MNSLRVEYESSASCMDCDEEILEAYYFNDKNQPVHVTTATVGHYYSDGSARCEACHDASR